MKIVQINATCTAGSTGKICAAVSGLLSEEGVENYILFSGGKGLENVGIRYAPQKKTGALEARVFGNWGFEGKTATSALIRELDEISPDVIHLHNIHHHACNLEMLFSWIKAHRVKVFWTFHDCWAFTGYCMYYDAAGCEKWKTGCGSCPQKSAYSFFADKSASLWAKKKALFQNLDLTVITPSKWLAQQVKQSFLKDHPVKVIYNGIDTAAFRPTPSDFRVERKIGGRHMILGVSMGWEKRKGLDVFIQLARRLGEEYSVVLVGTDDAVDKQLPSGVISVHRTQSVEELAKIYSAADVFVNPTREDNFPTVNLEALACGTPVVTFRTGGSPETIDESCGSVVDKNDVDALENEIRRICEAKPYPPENCTARAALFDKNQRFKEYLSLYYHHE